MKPFFIGHLCESDLSFISIRYIWRFNDTIFRSSRYFSDFNRHWPCRLVPDEYTVNFVPRLSEFSRVCLAISAFPLSSAKKRKIIKQAIEGWIKINWSSIGSSIVRTRLRDPCTSARYKAWILNYREIFVSLDTLEQRILFYTEEY